MVYKGKYHQTNHHTNHNFIFSSITNRLVSLQNISDTGLHPVNTLSRQTIQTPLLLVNFQSLESRAVQVTIMVKFTPGTMK